MPTPDPDGIRWTPRMHYDAAVVDLRDGPWQHALVHVLMGILAVLMKLEDQT